MARGKRAPVRVLVGVFSLLVILVLLLTSTNIVFFTIGALGGQGGFFPPIVLGVVKENTGGYVLGFVLFALAALLALIADLAVLGAGRRDADLEPSGTRAAG